MNTGGVEEIPCAENLSCDYRSSVIDETTDGIFDESPNAVDLTVDENANVIELGTMPRTLAITRLDCGLKIPT